MTSARARSGHAARVGDEALDVAKQLRPEDVQLGLEEAIKRGRVRAKRAAHVVFARLVLLELRVDELD